MLLWEVLVITIETLRGIQPESGVSTGSMDSMRYGHPSQSEAWTNTVVALTKLLMTELRRRLVKDGVKEEAHICCSVLADLLVLAEQLLIAYACLPGIDCMMCCSANCWGALHMVCKDHAAVAVM